MEEIKKIPLRSEVAKEDTWATEDMYATDEAWQAELATLAADQEKAVSYAGKLGTSGKTLYEYLSMSEEVHVKISLLANYCMRKADEDTREAKYQAMRGQFMNVAVGLSAATSFETPEIMAIEDDVMEAFYAEEPGLERYRRYLTKLRRRKAHTLSPAEEKLLAAAGEMADAPDTIYGAFADADITFPDAVDANGNKHPLSQGTFVPSQESPDRVLRKSAYENLYHTFASYKNTAAAMLNAQGKQLKFYADARKYPSTLEASLDRTEVPTSVYLNLIEAVHQNLDKGTCQSACQKSNQIIHHFKTTPLSIPMQPHVRFREPYLPHWRSQKTTELRSEQTESVSTFLHACSVKCSRSVLPLHSRNRFRHCVHPEIWNRKWSGHSPYAV